MNAERYFKMVAHILATLPIKPVPVRLYPHGLASVQQGFEDMKSGKVGTSVEMAGFRIDYSLDPRRKDHLQNRGHTGIVNLAVFQLGREPAKHNLS